MPWLQGTNACPWVQPCRSECPSEDGQQYGSEHEHHLASQSTGTEGHAISQE